MQVSWKTRRKGYWLFKNGKVLKEIETEKRIHFTILNESENHQVIYDKEKNSWSCDCQFFALKFNECSHIIACQLLLRDENAG